MDDYQNNAPQTEPQAAPQAAPQPVQQPIVQQFVQPPITADTLPTQYRPLGAWAYFGYSLLFAIPIVGFILLIVFSFSDKNINRRSFARSYWCWLVVFLIVFAIVLVVGLITGVTIDPSTLARSGIG